MELSTFIIIGLPLVAVISYVLSRMEKKEYTEDMLDMIFSKKCKNSGRRISGIKDHFELVNGLTESELKNNDIWQQKKL